MTSSCLFGHYPVSFHNLLAENLSRHCQAWSSSSSPMKKFTFALITLYYLSLPFFEYHLAPFPFPTFLSKEGNTNVRETQEDPQLSACLGSNKRDLTCQHVSGNREPRCSCLLDSWNQLFKKWGNENWGWYIHMYQPHCHFLIRKGVIEENFVFGHSLHFGQYPTIQLKVRLG